MLSDRTTYAPDKNHAARAAADGLGAVNESTVSHVLRTAGGAPTQSLCTTPLNAPGAAHHVCLLQSARKHTQRCPVAAGLSHRTSARSGPVHGLRLALLRAWAFASLLYTSPLYANCSNCPLTSVGGSRTGPPAAAMMARRAAQHAAFCFFVRPRRRVAGLKEHRQPLGQPPLRQLPRRDGLHRVDGEGALLRCARRCATRTQSQPPPARRRAV